MVVHSLTSFGLYVRVTTVATGCDAWTKDLSVRTEEAPIREYCFNGLSAV